MRHVRRIDPERAHEGKKVFDSESEARYAAEVASVTYSARMEAYQCVVCGEWHIGHAIHPQRRRRQQHSRVGQVIESEV